MIHKHLHTDTYFDEMNQNSINVTHDKGSSDVKENECLRQNNKYLRGIAAVQRILQAQKQPTKQI